MTVPYKYAAEADDAANKVSQRKRIGMTPLAGSETQRISVDSCTTSCYANRAKIKDVLCEINLLILLNIFGSAL